MVFIKFSSFFLQLFVLRMASNWFTILATSQILLLTSVNSTQLVGILQHQTGTPVRQKFYAKQKNVKAFNMSLINQIRIIFMDLLKKWIWSVGAKKRLQVLDPCFSLEMRLVFSLFFCLIKLEELQRLNTLFYPQLLLDLI